METNIQIKSFIMSIRLISMRHILKSNLSLLHSLYYAEAFNEFAGPISESFVDNTASLKEMPQGW